MKLVYSSEKMPACTMTLCLVYAPISTQASGADMTKRTPLPVTTNTAIPSTRLGVPEVPLSGSLGINMRELV